MFVIIWSYVHIKGDKMKIVIPVDSDKKTVIKRTGQASYFLIHENETLIKIVENNHGKHHHHDHSHLNHQEHTNEHKRDIQELKGADIILVQAIGEHMREALESFGIKIKKIRQKDGKIASEVIENFLKGNL